MTVRKVLNKTVLPLRPGDSVERGLDLMTEFKSSHLPVVRPDGTLAGMVSEQQLLQVPDVDLPVEIFLSEYPVTVRPDTHIFDATKIIVANQLDALIVVDEEGQFIGCVLRKDIFEQFAWMLATHESGAILILEMNLRDYSLSKLMHVVEQSDVKVLSVSSERLNDEDDTMRVTLKLNASDTTRIRHVLEYHGYTVVGSHSQHYYDEELQLRVQEFMRYLEV